MTKVSQLEMVAAYKRLLDARAAAKTTEEIEAAQDDLAHYLRMLGTGRIQEWFANRTVTP